MMETGLKMPKVTVFGPSESYGEFCFQEVLPHQSARSQSSGFIYLRLLNPWPSYLLTNQDPSYKMVALHRATLGKRYKIKDPTCVA